MIFNIVIAFVIPWIFMIILYFKNKKILLIIAPFQTAIAYTINAIGFYYGFWDLYPFNNKEIVHLPFDLGIYPMLSVYMIYYIHLKKTNPFTIIFIFTLLTTSIEGAGVIIGNVVYGHGWNIGGTFISYLIPYILNYAYYICLKNLGVFKNSPYY